MKRLTFILLIGLASCYNQKKATTQFNKAVLSFPKIPLDYCAAQFPDKPDSVIIRTDTIINIATMDSLVYDTLLLNHDTTLIRTIVKTVKIYINKDSIIYRENTANVERCELVLREAQNNNNQLLKDNHEKDLVIADWKKKAKTRWLWIALLIGGAAAYTAFKIWKPKINI
jgi:hypothetical protein